MRTETEDEKEPVERILSWDTPKNTPSDVATFRFTKIKKKKRPNLVAPPEGREVDFGEIHCRQIWSSGLSFIKLSPRSARRILVWDLVN